MKRFFVVSSYKSFNSSQKSGGECCLILLEKSKVKTLVNPIKKND